MYVKRQIIEVVSLCSNRFTSLRFILVTAASRLLASSWASMHSKFAVAALFGWNLDWVVFVNVGLLTFILSTQVYNF